MSITKLSIQTQLTYLMASGLLDAFKRIAAETGVGSNLLLAVASRESNMGMSLDENGLGDSGNGIGIMQIDRRYHPEYARQHSPFDYANNIRKSAYILKKDLQNFGGNKHQALAAYNAGTGSVRQAIIQGLNPDLFTTGQNYAQNVLTRYKLINGLMGTGGLTTTQKVGIGAALAIGFAGTFLYLNLKSTSKHK